MTSNRFGPPTLDRFGEGVTLRFALLTRSEAGNGQGHGGCRDVPAGASGGCDSNDA